MITCTAIFSAISSAEVVEIKLKYILVYVEKESGQLIKNKAPKIFFILKM